MVITGCVVDGVGSAGLGLIAVVAIELPLGALAGAVTPSASEYVIN